MYDNLDDDEISVLLLDTVKKINSRTLKRREFTHYLGRYRALIREIDARIFSTEAETCLYQTLRR